MEMITKSEKEGLEQRLKALVENRPKISERIAEARALGDLKENGDYHAAREQQGMEEAEIRRLSERIARASVVDDNQKVDFVFIGATIKVREDGSDDIETFKMVGEASGQLSDEYFEVTATSPMGEALMKARVGDAVSVRTPRGLKKFHIVALG